MRTSSPWKCRLAAVCLAWTFTAFAVPSSRAEDVTRRSPRDVDVARDTATTEPAHEPAKPTLLPEVNLQDVALPEVINFLREVDPSFQAVVSYDPGATRGEPKIQELQLRNVSADAVLELLAKTYPQITVSVVGADGPAKSKIWSIRVGSDERTFGMRGGRSREQERQMPQPVTVVLRLREIVDVIAEPGGKEGERKKALESVVSLVQAALETDAAGNTAAAKAEGKSDTILKVHEATETLIFHGSRGQSELVAQALETLQPREDRDVNTQRQIDRLTTQLRQLKDQLALAEAAVRRARSQTRPADDSGK